VKSAIRILAELLPELVLAPERHVALEQTGDGVPLGDLVDERRERIDPGREALVLDTSHARDGILDVAGALRDGAGTKSAKKRARAGDLVISRLRPYLRQVALVHLGALAVAQGRPLAISTEFYVLAPRPPASDLAFLLPFLLSERAQAGLAAAQEGGHHPRVPRSSLFALRVPQVLVHGRVRSSRAVDAALASFYAATSRVRALIDA
jgi:hypothetical protein